MKKIGIIIVLVGLVLTIFTTITFFTKKKVAQIGTIEVTRSKMHYLNWSPITGIVIMGIGGIIFWQTYNDR